MPSFQSQPISDFDRGQPLLSLAFPSLFPTGAAEFCSVRPRTVSYRDFVKHLLLYKDGRFARHPTLRYFVFNTIIRQEVSKNASFYVKNLSPARGLSFEDIQEAFANNSPEAQAIVNSITRFSGRIKGTVPYWSAELRSLRATVRQNHCPAFFFTALAADNHWHSLARYLPRDEYDEWKRGNATVHRRMLSSFVMDNPLIAAEHFVRRFRAFRDKVLVPKFKVDDWWCRYEWQGRGTTHNHGLCWSSSCSATGGDLDTPEGRRRFIDFWGYHVQDINPLPEGTTDWEGSPLQLAFEEQTNTFDDLQQVLNRVQRHRCTDAYCLRQNRSTGVVECRFGAPWRLRDEPDLVKEPGRSWFKSSLLEMIIS